MPEVELSAGTVHYEDSGGDGPVLVLTHGLLMDATMWDPVLAALGHDYRVVRPVLPLGSHPHPMRAWLGSRACSASSSSISTCARSPSA